MVLLKSRRMVTERNSFITLGGYITMKDLRNIIADNNQVAEKAQANNEVYVLTVLVNNGDDIDEAFTKLFKYDSLAKKYVKNFVDEVKGDFDTCQVDYGEDYAYTDIAAGDYSEYHANLSIEKQGIIGDEKDF